MVMGWMHGWERGEKMSRLVGQLVNIISFLARADAPSVPMTNFACTISVSGSPGCGASLCSLTYITHREAQEQQTKSQ